MAPLFSEVFDEDPLSEEGIARQTDFLRRLAAVMFEGAPSADDRPSGDESA